MKNVTYTLENEFKVLAGTPRSQTAEMVIQPGKSEGGPDNRHESSDQWLYVVTGSGTAIVEGRELPLTPGSLLLIEAGERHEIRNTGQLLLKTINFYAPPEYDSNE